MSEKLFTGGIYKMTQNHLLEIHECDEGYDFTLYDEKLAEIDGGVLESDTWLDEEYVIKEILAFVGYENERVIAIDTSEEF